MSEDAPVQTGHCFEDDECGRGTQGSMRGWIYGLRMLAVTNQRDVPIDELCTSRIGRLSEKDGTPEPQIKSRLGGTTMAARASRKALGSVGRARGGSIQPPTVQRRAGGRSSCGLSNEDSAQSQSSRGGPPHRVSMPLASPCGLRAKRSLAQRAWAFLTPHGVCAPVFFLQFCFWYLLRFCFWTDFCGALSQETDRVISIGRERVLSEASGSEYAQRHYMRVPSTVREDEECEWMRARRCESHRAETEIDPPCAARPWAVDRPVEEAALHIATKRSSTLTRIQRGSMPAAVTHMHAVHCSTEVRRRMTSHRPSMHAACPVHATTPRSSASGQSLVPRSISRPLITSISPSRRSLLGQASADRGSMSGGHPSRMAHQSGSHALPMSPGGGIKHPEYVSSSGQSPPSPESNMLPEIRPRIGRLTVEGSGAR